MTAEDRAKVRAAIDARARARMEEERAAQARVREENFAMMRADRRERELAETVAMTAAIAAGGRCSLCGCLLDEFTPGCRTCSWRLANYRRRGLVAA